MQLARALFLLILIGSSPAFSQAVKLGDIKKLFVENSLEKYVHSGQTVVAFFDSIYANVSNPSALDGGFAAESFDLEYQAHLRPHVTEPYLSLVELTKDTNNLLKIHRRFLPQIRNRVFMRNYFQTAFIGLLHTIESIKKVQVGLPQDGYSVLANLILEHGRLITSDQKSIVTMTDFWWDYMWAYFTNYPIDIVEMGNQKLRGVWLNEKEDNFKKSIEKFLAAYSMLGLRKATAPIVYRDITNQLFLRLSKNAYEIYGLRDDAKALSKARIFKYKYETKSGLAEEAEKTKREIAREGLLSRLKKLYTEPADQMLETRPPLLPRLFSAFMSLLYGIYSFIRYSVGFLLITFPFDAAFIVGGLIILSIEGRTQFEKEFWRHKPLTAQRKKSIPLRMIFRLRTFVARIINDLVFGLQMLVHSYTSDSSTRNVRIGSSLLIFGLGLFFSSARAMVDSFVAQMSV